MPNGFAFFAGSDSAAERGRLNWGHKATQDFSEWLKLKGILHTNYAMKGTHNWTVWMPCLNGVLLLLFE